MMGEKIWSCFLVFVVCYSRRKEETWETEESRIWCYCDWWEWKMEMESERLVSAIGSGRKWVGGLIELSERREGTGSAEHREGGRGSRRIWAQRRKVGHD
ncbi:hypothetical protein M0R45_020111 [Rubus argutus]|uniref:Secreted protein n=1 Tax=Rubus argutus TaxID=59490 RepID=A0AAW1X930_RUBAR